MSQFPKFSEDELKVLGMKSPEYCFNREAEKLNPVITPKENFLRAVNHQPIAYIPSMSDRQSFAPRCIPDLLICACVTDGEEPTTVDQYGGKGWFGTEWVYVPQVGGATTLPGKPQLEDTSQLKDLEFPDLDAIDWAESARKNKDFIDRDRALMMHFICGYWERLMAFLETSEAAIALLDDDCKADINEFFIKLTDFYIALIDKCIEYYQPDGILLHDDWGHQRGYFFSPAVLDEVFVPHFKRLSDYIHSKGMFFELHSCGLNEQNVPYMIKSGIDLWIPQPMNDQKKLVKQYGDQIMIGVDWPVYSPDDPDEVVEKLAKDFFEEMKDYRFYYNDRRQPDMRFAKYLYKLGRNYY